MRLIILALFLTAGTTTLIVGQSANWYPSRCGAADQRGAANRITPAKVLEAKFGEPRKAALMWKPKNTMAIDDDKGEKLINLLDVLNEHDDVQNVYANFEVSDALMQKMSA